MPGIYIHIPFCSSKCYYCDFYSRVIKNSQTINDYVNAICKEIVLRKNYLETNKINTIYFGGGTPSILKIEHLIKIFDAIYMHFEISINNEITLEINPDDATKDYFEQLRKFTDVNRLSIGFQSFDNEQLKLMNRKHDSNTNFIAVENALAVNFTNISGDLIFGIPTQTIDSWQKNLETFFKLPVNHLSAYSLSVEQGTVFDKWFKSGKLTETDEETSLQMFNILMDEAEKHNFQHYEISNFAKEGFIAKHNFSYWTGEKYLGLGAAAHSFDGKSRQWNISNITQYIDKINKNEIPADIEILSEPDKFNEYILTRMRTYLGINMEFLQYTFFDYFCEIKPAIDKFLAEGLLSQNGQQISLTRKGKFVSDAIIRELFII